MLTGLRIRNLRLIRDLHMCVQPGVPVVLIGPNASGKSTVLEALDILANLEREGTGRAIDAWRGGLDGLRTVGVSEPLVLGASWPDGTPDVEDPTRHRVDYNVAFETGGSGFTVIAEESLGRVPHAGPFRTFLRRHGRDASFPMRGEQGETLRLEDPRFPAMAQLRHPDFDDLREVGRRLAGMVVYTGFVTTPRWAMVRPDSPTARDQPRTEEARRLEPDGRNLVSVLYTLFNYEERAFARIQHHLCQEFPNVQDLRFPPGTAQGTLQLKWRDRRFPREWLSTEQMSTGMVQFLCLLTALYQPADLGLVAFDEPEAHLHPSAIARFVTAAEEVASQRSVLLATHADHLLDALTDPSGIHICSPSGSGAVIEPVNAEALAAFREDWSMTELRRQGLLDPSNEDSAA